VYITSIYAKEGGEACWEKGGWRAGAEKELGFGQAELPFFTAELLNPRAGTMQPYC